jgi:hypothetical protein
VVGIPFPCEAIQESLPAMPRMKMRIALSITVMALDELSCNSVTRSSWLWMDLSEAEDAVIEFTVSDLILFVVVLC